MDLGVLAGADRPGYCGAVGGDSSCGGCTGLAESFDERGDAGIGRLTGGWDDGRKEQGEAEGEAYGLHPESVACGLT